ncbi:MAG: FCD domain-containing protein [Rhodospirillales bacterium]
MQLSSSSNIFKLQLITVYSGEFVRIVESKRQFYNLLCQVADNSISINLLNRLTLLTSQLRRISITRPDRQTESIDKITALVSAIQEGDIVKARASAKLHVKNAALSVFSSGKF